MPSFIICFFLSIYIFILVHVIWKVRWKPVHLWGYLQVSIFQQCQDLGGHMVNDEQMKSDTLWCWPFFNVLFLVPLIGGRCYIMTYLAVRTTYIALIYCQLGDYMLPTTYYGNQETPLISHTERAVPIIRNCQLWIEPWPLKEDVAGLAAWNCSSTVWWIIHTDVSENMGTSKSSILIGFFHYEPSILGYPYFWKHPYPS